MYCINILQLGQTIVTKSTLINDSSISLGFFFQQDGQVTTVTRMSMNAVLKVSAAMVIVQTLMVVFAVPALLLYTA